MIKNVFSTSFSRNGLVNGNSKEKWIAGFAADRLSEDWDHEQYPN